MPMEKLFDNPSVLHSKDTLSQVWPWVLWIVVDVRGAFGSVRQSGCFNINLYSPACTFPSLSFRESVSNPTIQMFFSLWLDLPLLLV